MFEVEFAAPDFFGDLIQTPRRDATIVIQITRENTGLQNQVQELTETVESRLRNSLTSDGDWRTTRPTYKPTSLPRPRLERLRLRQTNRISSLVLFIFCLYIYTFLINENYFYYFQKF